MLNDRSPQWQHAACRNHVNPDLWHGDGEKATYHDTALAIEICTGCDIRTECFEYAYSNGLSGIWGASTGYQRNKLRKEENRKEKKR